MFFFSDSLRLDEVVRMDFSVIGLTGGEVVWMNFRFLDTVVFCKPFKGYHKPG